MHTTENSSNLTVKYSLIQSMFWMSYASIIGFASIYLLDVGFSNTQIGLLTAIACAVSSILQPLVATYADKPDSIPLKKIILLLAMLVTSASALLLPFRSFALLTALFYGISITCLHLINPLNNALGMESMNQGHALNFGVARGCGSAAYAVIAYLLGLAVDRLGAISVPVSSTSVYVIFLLLIASFPFSKQKKTATEVKQSSAGPLAFFFTYKRFSMILIGSTCLFTSHVFLNNFAFQVVESKGGGSSEMGFTIALCAILELPAMFFFSFMVKKIRCDIWLRISGIFFFVKALSTFLVSTIQGLYAVQLFQTLGWAVICVASVYYVNSIMKPEDSIKGQAYFTMTLTLGNVLGSLLGGVLLDAAGVDRMLATGSIFGFIGMAILLIFTEKTKSH